MLTCNYRLNYHKRYNYSVTAVLSLFLLFFVSCQQAPPPPARAGYSNEFLPVLDKAQSFFDTGKDKEGIQYLDSAFNDISNPNINDRFRVLGFHFIFWQKSKHNYPRALLYADSMLTLAKKSTNTHDY